MNEKQPKINRKLMATQTGFHAHIMDTCNDSGNIMVCLINIVDLLQSVLTEFIMVVCE